MKKSILTACATLLLASAALVNAHDEGDNRPTKASAEFERIKSLAGTWQGKADLGQGPVDMTVNYRLLAGGSIVEERVFEGTPNEMVTMFYDKDGKLALTHYCVMGNRPAMVLKSADSKTLRFDLDPACGLTSKDAHMHALTLTFDNPNTITASCESYMEGKKMEASATTLKRVK